MSSNVLGPLFSTTAAAYASSRELIALHEEQLLLLAGRESTSGAGAVLRTTAAFAKFCEYVQRMAIGVLKDDEDGNAV